MASFSGQSPMLEKYAKRYTELCSDLFINKRCLRGKNCHFAHIAPPPGNDYWKKSYCPKFFDGNCKRGVLCNYIHHPNKTRQAKHLSGKELDEELEKLNPYGYNKQKSVTPPESVEEIRKKRLQKIKCEKSVQVDELTEKVGKVQLRYE